MTIPVVGIILLIVIYTGIVVVIDRILIARTKGRDVPINKFPEPVPALSEYEKTIIPLYQAEWKTIIETQMHFNDLIIRFRSIVLTAFITLVGASVALQNTEKIDERQLRAIFCVLFVLWGTAFVVDFFYYHRLLLGSVAQAMKFDESALGKRLGFFGLTTCISRMVHPPTSKIIVSLFYGIPTLALVLLFMYNYS